MGNFAVLNGLIGSIELGNSWDQVKERLLEHPQQDAYQNWIARTN